MIKTLAITTALALSPLTSANSDNALDYDQNIVNDQFCQVSQKMAQVIMTARQSEVDKAKMFGLISSDMKPSHRNLIEGLVNMAWQVDIKPNKSGKIEMAVKFGQFAYVNCVRAMND